MKIFVIGFGSRFPEHVRLVDELRGRHKLLYWVRMTNLLPLDEAAYPGTVIHDYYDALKGIPPKAFSSAQFDPWSPEEIVEYSDIEAELMVMMDKWYPRWPITKRKDFYYDLLRYWGGVLDGLEPDAIVMHTAPHEMYNFVLYAIAKKRGIRTIMSDVVLRYDRIITFEDYKVCDVTIAAAAAEGFKRDVQLSDLPPDIQDYYLELSGSRNPSPKYTEDFKKMHTPLRNVWRRLRKDTTRLIQEGVIIERGVNRFFKFFKSNAKKEHDTYVQPADFTESYIYVPLHYQPECTTSPQGGIFVDQILMIKMLAAALPEKWKLYVKEHPAQWKANTTDYTPQRYEGFYKEIAQLPRVQIVPLATNTFELTDNARAVATITGTAAWEGIMRGKPGVVFGYPYFRFAPGILRVASVADCRAVFSKIKDGFVPYKHEIFAYLDLLYKVSCRGFLSDFGERTATYRGDLRWREIYESIQRHLSSDD